MPGQERDMTGCVQFWDVDIKRNKIQAISLRSSQESRGERVMEELCVPL